jgi:hypothetical protein
MAHGMGAAERSAATMLKRAEIAGKQKLFYLKHLLAYLCANF